MKTITNLLPVLAVLLAPAMAHCQNAIERATASVWTTNEQIRQYQSKSEQFWANQNLPSQNTLYNPYPNNPKNIAIPAPVVQYLANTPAGLLAIPYQPFGGAGSTIIQVNPIKDPSNLPQYEQIRASYGGIYPYTVVNAREPFVIVSQTNDIVVIGRPNPQRVVVQQNPAYTVVNGPNGTPVVVPSHQGPPTNIIYFQGRIDVGVQLAPGVPPTILRKIDPFNHDQSTIEAVYQPNQKYAFSRGRYAQGGDGLSYRIFQVNLR
jgi:type II secretory pathway pseudopilin PulG